MELVYAVFTQYEPSYKYEEAMESIWTDLESATEHANVLAKSTAKFDWVFIRPLALNQYDMAVEEQDLIIKKP